jgi:hypothetical protein
MLRDMVHDHFCKKIRDDKDYWNQVDAYIEKHSDVDISHSISPECAEKYYPYKFHYQFHIVFILDSP